MVSGRISGSFMKAGSFSITKPEFQHGVKALAITGASSVTFVSSGA